MKRLWLALAVASTVGFVWRAYIVFASHREWLAGRREEALFVAIGNDPLGRVVLWLSEATDYRSLVALNAIGCALWLLLVGGFLLAFAWSRTRNEGLR